MNSLVSADWLHQHLNDPNLIILDASIPVAAKPVSSDFEGKRLPNARFFDLKKTFKDKTNEVPNMLPNTKEFEEGCRALGISNSSKIVVYDNIGIYSAPRVWWMFRTMGHEEVAVLDGGLPAWVAEGYPIEDTKEESYSMGDFAANYRPELVRSAQDVLANIENKEALVLDARSKGRFDGTAPEPRKGLRGGHIPNSISLPYSKLLQDGKFLAREELATVLQGLQLGDQPLVFSCGSGVTACILMLACEMVMDNEMAVYDGSWSEWGIPENEFPIDVD